jgi:hypothetical protein
VKKNLKKRDPEKPRRLTLSRETIKLLDDTKLLELAGAGTTTCTDITTSGHNISLENC